MKDLSIRPRTIEPLEENRNDQLLGIDCGNDILNLTSKAKVTTTKINKRDHIKR